MTTLYLIRHSLQLRDESIPNEEIILSPEGEKKAEELSKIEELQNLDVVFSSHYKRAISTAKYIAKENNLELIIDKRFGERIIGSTNEIEILEKMGVTSLTVEQLLNNDFKIPNGESMKEVNKRMTEGINELLDKYKDKRIAVVCHGACIKYYLMNYCTLNEDTKLVYNNKVLEFPSPCIIKLVFDNNNLIDLYNIKM